MPPGQPDSACLPPRTVSNDSWVDASPQLVVSRRLVSAVVLSSHCRDRACEETRPFFRIALVLSTSQISANDGPSLP
jgi:hypothetical protein